MPPYNWITGHLLAIKPFLMRQPPDALFNYALTEMAWSINSDAFYLDFWPIAGPMLVLKSPSMAMQMMQQNNPGKPDFVANTFTELAGGPNLISMEEGMWKKWRAMFNPILSTSAILQQAPRIVVECEKLCQKLRRRAHEGLVFQLEQDTLPLTLEVISVISLDKTFNYQLADSGIPRHLRSMINWGTFGSSLNPFKRWNPIRPLLVAYHGRKLSKYIGAVLEDDLAERRVRHDLSKESKLKKTKSMAELLVDAYLTEYGDKPGPMEPYFKYLACAQLRLFLIGGHDTTSSTLVYAYHLLYGNPTTLALVRTEHDEVLGKDISLAGARITANPTLLNKLPYTNACIKESMRMFPPASAMRAGTPDIVLKDRDGKLYPTAGWNVWSLHLAMHRSSELFKEPDSFRPERWLVGPDHPLHPPKGAYRPFEFGARSCPGQALSILEVTVTLAMTIREFDIHDAYSEWDTTRPKRGISVAFGDRPYAVEGGGGGSHPVDLYPCRISIAQDVASGGDNMIVESCDSQPLSTAASPEMGT
ncbi:hypothetical protein JX265_009828 [Neoarthrinium moseri]|uniref:Cytochrome P450 n=1 Tax=Neoarthrinium moseri TaxID=1658444 RepID=A0A9P9WFE2_9PEZI|nr:uncharacterized protein JN550_005419 [Neoarthrinium moseri]KAI1860429.1 hypothetical protein JX265_009828 [Neoarthrinium moseri]KAI1869829.1 hypothetical protein JN550_005419 [Neoarthrinium moseri]